MKTVELPENPQSGPSETARKVKPKRRYPRHLSCELAWRLESLGIDPRRCSRSRALAFVEAWKKNGCKVPEKWKKELAKDNPDYSQLVKTKHPWVMDNKRLFRGGR